MCILSPIHIQKSSENTAPLEIKGSLYLAGPELNHDQSPLWEQATWGGALRVPEPLVPCSWHLTVPPHRGTVCQRHHVLLSHGASASTRTTLSPVIAFYFSTTLQWTHFYNCVRTCVFVYYLRTSFHGGIGGILKYLFYKNRGKGTLGLALMWLRPHVLVQETEPRQSPGWRPRGRHPPASLELP